MENKTLDLHSCSMENKTLDLYSCSLEELQEALRFKQEEAPRLALVKSYEEAREAIYTQELPESASLVQVKEAIESNIALLRNLLPLSSVKSEGVRKSNGLAQFALTCESEGLLGQWTKRGKLPYLAASKLLEKQGREAVSSQSEVEDVKEFLPFLPHSLVNPLKDCTKILSGAKVFEVSHNAEGEVKISLA